jgi:hypothetical protein
VTLDCRAFLFIVIGSHVRFESAVFSRIGQQRNVDRGGVRGGLRLPDKPVSA